MLISKNVQIEFADSSMKAIDAIYDIREGVKSASLNLYSRYDVQIPEEIIETFSIGPHLKGIANYLLKNCNGRYDKYLVGRRLLVYTEVAPPKASDNRFTMEDRLEAIARFAKLLERSDEKSMDAISQILRALEAASTAI